MIDKVTSSPSFKSNVTVVFATQEKLRKGERGTSFSQLNEKFYNSSTMRKELKKIENDNRDNHVTFFPARDENCRPYMQMHVLSDDIEGEGGKSYGMARIYNPREIEDRYTSLCQSLNKIDDSIGVYDYLG